jgi:Skp family chaperone for outer membrane proteins
MKKIYYLILMIVGMTFITACNSNPPKSDINLNNGERWIVNSEMKPHIEKGSQLIDKFLSDDEKNYQKLAENLKEQNNALIKSCTMKGESHDELHKWLHPHIDLVKKLSDASSWHDAEPIISELNNSYEKYNNYFQ